MGPKLPPRSRRQGAHPRMQAGRRADALRRPLAALGDMLGGPALGRVDEAPGEQGIAGAGEVARRGEGFEAARRGALRCVFEKSKWRPGGRG